MGARRLQGGKKGGVEAIVGVVSLSRGKRCGVAETATSEEGTRIGNNPERTKTFSATGRNCWKGGKKGKLVNNSIR